MRSSWCACLPPLSSRRRFGKWRRTSLASESSLPEPAPVRVCECTAWRVCQPRCRCGSSGEPGAGCTSLERPLSAARNRSRRRTATAHVAQRCWVREARDATDAHYGLEVRYGAGRRYVSCRLDRTTLATHKLCGHARGEDQRGAVSHAGPSACADVRVRIPSSTVYLDRLCSALTLLHGMHMWVGRCTDVVRACARVRACVRVYPCVPMYMCACMHACVSVCPCPCVRVRVGVGGLCVYPLRERVLRARSCTASRGPATLHRVLLRGWLPASLRAKGGL